jgi:release factor glutamine methyltransferase
MAEQTWTLGSLLSWTAKHLADKNVESPRLDAEILLAHAAGCRRIDLYGTRFAEPASAEARQTYRALIGKRLEGCPVAYLVGKKEFYNLELEVSPAVLIPRPDSELVVMECLKLAKSLPRPKIVDVGTGSGNLAIAVAKHLSAAEVTAIDKSADALAIARKNAERHGVAERMRFFQGDLLAPLAADECFDFVLSNPPYIPSGDIAGLSVGVRDYEPHLALDGGADGFVVFDRLVQEATGRLAEGGYLLIEIGAPQEGPARQRLGQIAELELLPTIYDFSRHPRVLAARRRR